MSENRQFNHYRPENTELRRAECARITALMKSDRPFSFLRLGDMELMFLIAAQNGTDVSWKDKINGEKDLVSSTVAFGHPGLRAEHAPRLQAAYEHCSYLDFHDGWIVNKREFPNWRYVRSPDAHRNPGAAVSQLFFDWLRYEFHGYVERRRCLFIGAEAGILAALYEQPLYRKASANYWPPGAEPIFLGETRRVGESLDDIKKDLAKSIKDNQVDTIFVSLGGASKILCYELAEELNIAAFDFGGLMRGLTYSGSDGHNFFRATHYPFYFRVPFETYMSALHQSSPDLPPEKVLAKAHAQLMIELIRKEEGWSYASERGGDDCIDLSAENVSHFWRSYARYQELYGHLRTLNSDTIRQVHEFESWRRQLGLGIDGKLLKVSSAGKATLRKVVRRYLHV